MAEWIAVRRRVSLWALVALTRPCASSSWKRSSRPAFKRRSTPWNNSVTTSARSAESLALALEQARYEVDRAQRQYDLVDPANRLVAGELESRWNAALARATELDRQLAELEQAQETVTPEEREWLLEFGHDLPLLWDQPAATAELKKRLLRAALREIVIADNEDRSEHLLIMHWQGGVHTELRVKRTKTGQHRRVADADVIALVSELSKVCTDQTTAATLNRLGYRTGTGKTWRAA